MIRTPAYLYDIDRLKAWISDIQGEIPGIPMTFSVKANSFVIDAISDAVSHLEVCSPGELHICRELGIQPEKIIYSGVMKEKCDIIEAIEYGAYILTAESLNHFQMISAISDELNTPVNVLLRISSDNQFGMDPKDIYAILARLKESKNVHLLGFHYYSGTQKKKADQIGADIARICSVIDTCEKEYGYKPELVEYGPGLAIEYFKDNNDELDLALFNKIKPLLCEFARNVPLGIEMGRFLVAGCGTYYTTVKDIKNNYGIQYVILDGGIHHIRYYGQIMSINSPIITQQVCRDGGKKKYCLCGSLCTVADVMVKEIELQELKIGDVLEFHKCGAYSLTEASGLFLSRDMPCVYLQENGSIKLVRGFVHSSDINTIGYAVQ